MSSINKEWVENHIDSNGEVIIPEGIEKIEPEAFKDNELVRKVVMPNSIVEIGVNAFNGCSNLQEIKFSNNIKRISNNAFKNCTSLSDIELPENLEEIGTASFRNCINLKNIRVGDKIKSIGQLSFAGSGIEQIELPSSLEKVDVLAFWNCSNLQQILGGKNISIIEDAAFQGTGITEFEIPNQITTIKANVFGQNPNLSSITLNAELDFLSERAFSFSDNLKEINIEGTQRINYGAFMNNSNVQRINIDGQEVMLADNEHLFSLQKSGNKVAIVVQDEKGEFSTKAINLEKQTRKTIGKNTYLTEEGNLCFAVNSIADVSLGELKQWQKSGLSQLYIYGGDNEIMPSEHEKGMNFNLYNLDDLIQIKTRIEEIKRQVKIPNVQDKHREKKIYGQIIRLLSENLEYDYWEAGTSKEKYERMTRKKF